MSNVPRAGERITEPFIVPREWDVERRLVALNQIVADCASDPVMKVAAARVMAEAHRMALVTPNYDGDWFGRLVALEILRLVHRVPYVAGPEGDDEFAPASYTLTHGGDCDRLNTLVAGLCCLCGLVGWVDWVEQPGQQLDHVPAEVVLDDARFWMEGSVRGAVVGESPWHAVERQGAWHVVGRGPEGRPDGHPATFEWDGWRELWRGWPVAWFREHYPYLFHPNAKP